MTSQTTGAAPIALHAGEGQALWFLGALVIVKAADETTAGRVMVSETFAPRGHGSPLHVHRHEDEWFYVLEGEVTFWVDGEVVVGTAGTFVYGPRDHPHTFMVTSDVARFLLVTEPGDFSGFVRAVAEPAAERVIPPPATEPPDMAALAAAAAEYGVEFLGPPGIPAGGAAG
ncbi:MAG TPA: quercetin 2,3-dioxygenase [Solirubrobacteraceae bacterium]|nr:quercetin 2,3-dioxygenase [Solirubrobacteraceae bacterium]